MQNSFFMIFTRRNILKLILCVFSKEWWLKSIWSVRQNFLLFLLKLYVGFDKVTNVQKDFQKKATMHRFFSVVDPSPMSALSLLIYECNKMLDMSNDHEYVNKCLHLATQAIIYCFHYKILTLNIQTLWLRNRCLRRKM